MNRRNKTGLFALAAGLTCWTFGLGCPLQAQTTNNLVMVVNKANNAAAGMTVGEARKLLLGETTAWRGGSKVLVVLGPAGSNGRAAVLKKVCGMSETVYTRYELQAAFSGQTAAVVTEAPTDEAIRDRIKANAGAIGFLHQNKVDQSVQSVLTLE
jgi:ABC-type phosphate transport system substrate-binding protein